MGEANTQARRDWLRAAFYAGVLLWLNVYVARDFFSGHTAHMNSMHGFWIAIARRGGWLHPSWWPFWDSGIPLEATYAPLVPALSAMWAGLFHTPMDMAFSSITGLAYCLAPLTLFLMAWVLTGKPGVSFFASLIYSLLAPTQWLVPDGDFHWSRILEARRLFLVADWDDTPHLLALALLPLAILFLWLSVERKRPQYYAGAAIAIALMAGASAFGPIMVAMAVVALLAASPQGTRGGRILLIAAIGVCAYLMVMAFVPPSVLGAIRESTNASDEEKWTLGSLTGIAAALLGFTIVRYWVQRRTKDSRVAFFAYFTWIAGCVPLAAAYLNRRIMPQPVRYKFELELGLALALAFAAAALLERIPVSIRRAAILLALAFAAEQVADYRKLEKEYTFPQDVTKTVEYRGAAWAQANLPGVRVFFPGSMAQWTNAYSDVPQFTGSSWSMATNQSEQKADAAIAFETRPVDDGAKLSLVWLKAYGAGAIAVNGADSTEFWKPFSDPGKFDALPAVWKESGVTIRRIPQRSPSLAHVVPESAIVQHPPRIPEDTAAAARYVSALDDPMLPEATFAWSGREHIRIRATLAAGQVVSVQESYHPGWHATVNGKPRELFKDGLGLMWLRPGETGECDISLDYNGGWEWWICHIVSYLTIAGVLTGLVIALRNQVSHRH